MSNVRKRQSYGKYIGTDKGECQYFHAKKRARQRLGFDLTEDDYDRLIACVKNPEKAESKGIGVKFIEKQSCRVSRYRIEIKNLPAFDVVYDSMRETIVTFLYPEPEGTFKIHRYVDKFGNMVSCKTEYGNAFELNLNTNELKIPSEKISFIGVDAKGNETWRNWQTEDHKVFGWHEESKVLVERIIQM